MGIRFHCPNGHRLNVKAFLAGERGLCPHCDAKFIIPEVSGGAVVAIDAAASGATRAAPPPAPRNQSRADAWYVRPASGGQYGPATTDVMRDWAADGRVAGDSWVWRTGWPEWKQGAEAVALLNGSALESRPPEVADPPLSPATTEPSLRGVSPTQLHRNSRRQRRERARTMTLALGGLVVLLLVALVWVLAG